MTIYIFTDGASKGNPGPGGFGAVVASGVVVREIGGGEKVTTNNRMELMAAIVALEELGNVTDKICVFSDSSYLINGITKWVFGWQKKDWKTATKADVANTELWQRLLVVTQSKAIDWKYVPGHSRVAGNERANDIAEDFARGKEIELYSGAADSYTEKLLEGDQPLDQSGVVSDLKKALAAKKKNKGKAYSYVSLVSGQIETHSTWDECKRRVEGKSARYKKALSKEDEAEIIRDLQS